MATSRISFPPLPSLKELEDEERITGAKFPPLPSPEELAQAEEVDQKRAAYSSALEQAGALPEGTPLPEQPGLPGIVQPLKQAGLQLKGGVEDVSRAISGVAPEVAGTALQVGSEKVANFFGENLPPQIAGMVRSGQSVGEELKDIGMSQQSRLQKGQTGDPRSFMDMLFRSVPQLGVSAGAAATAGPFAAIGLGGLMEGSAGFERAKSEGATDEEALFAGVTTGVVNGVLEGLGATKAVQPLLSALNTRGLVQLGKVFITQGIPEAGTEAIQEFMQDLIALGTYMEDPEAGDKQPDLTFNELSSLFEPENLKRYGKASAAGQILGGGTATAIASVTSQAPAAAAETGQAINEREAPVSREAPVPREASARPLRGAEALEQELADRPLEIPTDTPQAAAEAAAEVMREESSEVRRVRQAPVEERMAVAELESAQEQSSKTPEWLSEEPTTKLGKKIVGRLRKDLEGKKAGPREIVDYVHKVVGAELRVGKEQTTPRNPAHFNLLAHLTRQRQGGSVDFASHEAAGHGLSNLIRGEQTVRGEKHTGWDPRREFGNELLQIALMPGSHASAQNVEEGLAEWARRYIVDIQSISDMEVTRRLEEELGARYPNVLEGFRDAARAFQAHMDRPVESRFRSENLPPPRSGFPTVLRDTVDRAVFEAVARGHGISRMERGLYAALEEVDPLSYKGTPRNRARAARLIDEMKIAAGAEADLRTAYQGILQVKAETERAVHGGGLRVRWQPGVSRIPAKAVRVMRKIGLDVPTPEGLDPGDFINLTDFSIADVLDDVGRNNISDFENYARAKVEYARYKAKKLHYPGYYRSVEPKHLVQTWKKYEADHPEWKDSFSQLNYYADQLLVGAVIAGVHTPLEAAKMKRAYDHYLPLLPYVEREGSLTHRPSSSPQVDPGFRRATGSAAPKKSPIANLAQRTNEVLNAIAHNQAMLAPVMMAESARRNPGLKGKGGFALRNAASRVAVRLKLDTKVAATLTPEEGSKIIAEYLNKIHGDDLAYPLQPSDVEVHWSGKPIFRSTSPRAVNVIAPMVGGKRVFYQIEDPILYDMFSASRDPGKVVSLLTRAAVGVTRPWKKLRTQNVLFAGRNVFRDQPTAMVLSESPESLTPGYLAAVGVVAKLTGTVPDAVVGTELLSRSHSTAMSLQQKAKWGWWKQLLLDGVVTEGFSELTVGERAAELPGIAMSAGLKPFEIVLALTGQRWVSQSLEEVTRIGAFKTAKRRGATDAEAQTAYDMVSGNFGETAGNPVAAALYRHAGFLNPGLQIQYQTWDKILSPDPRVQAQYVGRLGWVSMLTALGWAAHQMFLSEEDRERIGEISEEDRLSYIPLFGRVRIPFDYGHTGAVSSWVWNMLDQQAGYGPESKSLGRLVVKRFLDLPGNPLSVLQPLLKSLIEAQVDYSLYWGEHIEESWMREIDNPVDRAYEMTPELYKKMTEALSKDGERQWVWGPLRIQHVVRSGLGSEIDGLVRFLDRYEKGGIDLAVRGKWYLPFVGRFFQRDPVGWASQSVEDLETLDRRYLNLTNRINRTLQDPTMSDRERQILVFEQNTLKYFHDSMLRVRDLGRYADMWRERGDSEAADSFLEEMTVEAQLALRYAERSFQEIEEAKKRFRREN